MKTEDQIIQIINPVEFHRLKPNSFCDLCGKVSSNVVWMKLNSNPTQSVGLCVICLKDAYSKAKE